MSKGEIAQWILLGCMGLLVYPSFSLVKINKIATGFLLIQFLILWYAYMALRNIEKKRSQE